MELFAGELIVNGCRKRGNAELEEFFRLAREVWLGFDMPLPIVADEGGEFRPGGASARVLGVDEALVLLDRKG